MLSILSGVFGVETDEFMRRRHDSALRGVAARYLLRYAGQSQRDVADLLGIGSGSAVNGQLKRLPGKIAADRRLRQQVAKAEEQLMTAWKKRSERKCVRNSGL